MINIPITLFYILLGILPSTIWLLFYLRKDAHPEPKKQVIEIFFYGMLITIPAVLIEIYLTKSLNFLHFLPLSLILFSLIEIFIGIAFVEEFSKYLVVKWGMFRNSELDEPVDIMIYMIIAALGFAAAENVFLLFSFWEEVLLGQVVIITFGRFVSATFLHALASGILGYFLALSFFEAKRGWTLLIKGLVIATTLHGFYNFSIILIEDPILKIIIILVLLSVMAFFVSVAFRKLKKLKSICKL